MGGVGGGEGFGKGESEGFGDAFAVCRVGAVAVADMSLFDKEFRIAHHYHSVGILFYYYGDESARTSSGFCYNRKYIHEFNEL